MPELLCPMIYYGSKSDLLTKVVFFVFEFYVFKENNCNEKNKNLLGDNRTD